VSLIRHSKIFGSQFGTSFVSPFRQL